MKTRMLLAAFVATVLAFGSNLRAEDAADLKDVKCPVSGKAVNPEQTVEFNGGKVYFCCGNCAKAFQANTEKFTPKANHQLALTGQIKQEGCPLSGGKLNPDTAIDVQGVKVAFCCKNCKGKAVAKEGDELLLLVFGPKAKGWESATAAK